MIAQDHWALERQVQECSRRSPATWRVSARPEAAAVIDTDSGHSGGTILLYAYVPHGSDRGQDAKTAAPFLSCCTCAYVLLLNGNLQNVLFGIPMSISRTVAVRQSSADKKVAS